MWDDPRKLDALSLGLCLLALVLAGWGGSAWLVRQSWFEFQEVIVTTPLQRASGPQLESVIREELRGTFFTLDLERSRKTLAQVPWVRNVALRRQWPNRLAVEVEEHVALAKWNDAALVNTQGEVFAAEWNRALPQFEGPEGRTAVMTQQYLAWTQAMAPLGLSIQSLKLSARGGWELRASSSRGALAIELGRDDADARLARFVAGYGRTIDALERAGTRVAQVDLRYRNGFAVRAPDLKETTARKAS